MTYATPQDMIAQYGEAEVIQLSDRDMTGVRDDTVLEAALLQAGQEVDAYLSGRVTLPLSPVPALVVMLTCDIARYRLCGAAAQETEPVRVRYRDAVKLLNTIREGKLALGGDVAQDGPAARPAVQIRTPRRTFAGGAGYY